MPAPKKQIGWQHRKLGIPALWEAGFQGRGIRIAVLDTGLAKVTSLHRDTFEYLDEDGGKINPTDLDGHGTVCASVAVSARDGAFGIAPKAAVSSYRVLDSGDRATKVERALAAVVARPDVDVVLCAFIIDKVTQAIMDRVRELAVRGTVVVAAAGNDRAATSAFPEHTPHAITVAGLTQDLDALPDAQLGLWIDVSAPGVNLRAINASGGLVQFGDSSGAAAVVAGVAALMLSTQSSPARRRKVGMLFDDLARASAKQLPDAQPNTVGAGLVNPVAMLKLINEGI